MKPRKLKGVLSVILTFMLVASLTVFALPAMADVSEPTVSVDPDTIDTEADYTIIFDLTEELGSGDTITVRFPDDTDVPLATLVDGVDFEISAGSGAIGGTWLGATLSSVTAEGDDDDRTVIFTLGGSDAIGAGATVVINFVTTGTYSITNPTDAGDYTLEVKTSEEDTWVESEIYEIDAPTVGGGVYVRNSAGVLMDTFGGDEALNDAVAWFGAAYDDYTIEVGPGTYKLTGTITISAEGLTLKSSDGAEDTIIKASDHNPGILITADDVTVDDFTIDDALGDGIVIRYGTEGVTVQNCIITDAGWSGICLSYDVTYETAFVSEATVSGNVIEDCGAGINLLGCADDCTISDNTITESVNESIDIHGGTSANPTQDNTITGNIITGNDCMGIRIKADPTGTDYFDDNLISGNTISENDGDGIEILAGIDNMTGLVIMGNDIADNEDDGIDIWSWGDTNVICFNNITGNGDDAIDNAGNVGAIDATLNWWGTDVSADIDAEFEDDKTNDDFTPFLSGTVDTVLTGYNAVGDDDELDAEDEAGVEISDVVDTTADDTTDPADMTDMAERIKAAAYAANPEGEDTPDPAVAYYDVYVGYTADTTAPANDDDDDNLVEADVTMLLKLHVSGINDDMVAYAWSTTEESWVECSEQSVSEYGGYVVVTIEDGTEPALDELTGTTFAVVQAKPTAAGIPTLEAPDYGAEDVGLNPTFVWGTVEDADEYTLQVSTNPFFVDASEKAMLTHTVWRWDIALDNDTTYYWRVQAIDDGGESDWAESVFTTEAAPVAPPAPPAVLYTCPTCGLSFDTPAELQTHWAAVHVPPPAVPEPLPTTPAYIWVIIVVGAVLVIAVIALIVRTRRVV